MRLRWYVDVDAAGCLELVADEQHVVFVVVVVVVTLC